MTGLITSESGATATFSLVLLAAPVANVSIDVTSSDTSEGVVDLGTVILTPANWTLPHTVVVTGVDDDEIDGDQSYTIVLAPAVSGDSAYNGLDPADVAVTNEDNDVVGISVHPTSGLVVTESGTTATFTVNLTTLPTATVSIDLSSSDSTEGSVSPTSLSFTTDNGSTPQTVTVTGVDDSIQDGDQSFTVILARAISADPTFNDLDPPDVAVTNEDDDVPGFSVVPTSGLVVAESGTTATFTVGLRTQPAATVSIDLASSDSTEGSVSPASLSFSTSNWNTPKTVTVMGVADGTQDGDQSFTIITSTATSADSDYHGIDPADVSVVNQDVALPSFLITPTSLANSDPGSSATFTVRLVTAPTANVRLDLSSSDPSEGVPSPVSPVFTPSDWATPKTITVIPQTDGIVDFDNSFEILTAPAVSADPAYDGLNPVNVSVSNMDGDNIELVSVSSAEVEGNDTSSTPSVSADGRYVAFWSMATNLVGSDTNGGGDVFLRDRQLGTTIRVSVSSSGGQLTPGFWGSSSPSISGNGRCVAFTSDANSVVTGDSNNAIDVFVRDVVSNQTEQVNVSSSEIPANGTGDLFAQPRISHDCRYVAFSASATNLAGTDTNDVMDVFVRDRTAGTTERVSVSSSGGQANGQSVFGLSISADGRYVSFSSMATNLVTNDSNEFGDIFLRDRQSSTTTRVSLAYDGSQANNGSGFGGQIAPSGGLIVFPSNATNLVSMVDGNDVQDIFIRDLDQFDTRIASVSSSGQIGNGISSTPGVDAQGRYIVFVSAATNLVSGDTNGVSDIFVHDTETSSTTRVSLTNGGLQGNGTSSGAIISADGRAIVFNSEAANLVSGDTNGVADVFLVRRR